MSRIIPLPDGDVLERRRDFAKITLDVCDRTAARMNLPTTYIGNVAYVARNKSLRIIADRVRQKQQQRRGR